MYQAYGKFVLKKPLTDGPNVYFRQKLFHLGLEPILHTTNYAPPGHYNRPSIHHYRNHNCYNLKTIRVTPEAIVEFFTGDNIPTLSFQERLTLLLTDPQELLQSPHGPTTWLQHGTK